MQDNWYEVYESNILSGVRSAGAGIRLTSYNVLDAIERY